MRLQSRAVAVDVLGSIQQLVLDVVKFALQIAGLLAFAAAAPILYFFFGLFCARSGDSTFPMIYVCTSPLAVSIWVLVLSRFLSVRRWRQSGKDLGAMGSNWREAEGGLGVSILKSFLYMFLGGISSFAAQMAAVGMWAHFTGRAVFFAPLYMTDPTPHDLTVFWSFMPLVAFSPVIVVLVHHWVRRQ